MTNSNNSEVDLNKLAEEELLREAKRAVARSEVSGIEGFKKCPLPQTNKRFLTNTIVNNIKSNKRKTEAQNEKKKRFSTEKAKKASNNTLSVTRNQEKRKSVKKKSSSSVKKTNNSTR
ncbi:protein POLR1D-like [Homalodisca vitripennis]|uniref:protein POLR1D-like n=1 Tax=Homalodisca vitripennis TaxID=197043 RepID=UPI001EEACFDD|nr:protein POLR1D-like [Homalodisca vitripennis]